jgi:hypothetical protein
MFLLQIKSCRLSGDKEKNTMKKLLTLLFASVVAIPLATAVFAQKAPAQAKQAHWAGIITRSSTEQSNLTVRKEGTTQEKTVQYDSSTKWVSQEHGSKTINDIDRSQVKDGDYVICTGTYEKSILHATLISKRLSHSPAH